MFIFLYLKEVRTALIINFLFYFSTIFKINEKHTNNITAGGTRAHFLAISLTGFLSIFLDVTMFQPAKEEFRGYAHTVIIKRPNG